MLSLIGSQRIQKEAAFDDASLQLHNPVNDYSRLAFSNSGFPNNRFMISADPSSGGGENPAEMLFTWGSTVNPAGTVDFMSLNASDNVVEIKQNMQVEGALQIDEFYQLTPLTVAPSCPAGGAANGRVYFHGGADKTLRVCVCLLYTSPSPRD